IRRSCAASGPGSPSCLAGTERRPSSSASAAECWLFAIAVTDLDASVQGWYVRVHPPALAASENDRTRLPRLPVPPPALRRAARARAPVRCAPARIGDRPGRGAVRVLGHD